MKRTSKRYSLVLLVFVSLFLFSAYKVFHILIQDHKEQKIFAELEEIINISAGSAGNVLQMDAAGAKKASEPNSLSPYAALKEKNPDFFGWIAVEGTAIHYPVMHTPEDEEYYLHRDFYGESAQNGVPFLAAPCFEGCGNYLIYGHHMKNGSMFASLLRYADHGYWEEHPVIHFDTPAASGEYEVMAAFYSEVYSQDVRGVFRFYEYTDLSEPSVFTEYVKQVQNAALYDTGVFAEYGNELLSLCTCSYHTGNGRFVVVARKK